MTLFPVKFESLAFERTIADKIKRLSRIGQECFWLDAQEFSIKRVEERMFFDRFLEPAVTTRFATRFCVWRPGIYHELLITTDRRLMVTEYRYVAGASMCYWFIERSGLRGLKIKSE